MSTLLLKAHRFMAEFHGLQTRDDRKTPYIMHCMEVAQIADMLEMDEEFICACLLHDVLEDTKATEFRLYQEFPREVCKLVVCVSKWWLKSKNLVPKVLEENIKAYYDGILAYHRAPLLKLIDRTCNLLDFAQVPVSVRSANYVVKTQYEFGPIIQACKDTWPQACVEFGVAYTLLKAHVETKEV